ncbi:MAG: hypothetical protein J7M25_02365 [Deltaproteobacteria bacterium]|nr:hypothetical protein [Deltaproteobacteria bacterium]
MGRLDRPHCKEHLSSAGEALEPMTGVPAQQWADEALKISGAWWPPDHVDDILALRMLKDNGWWDEYWQTQRVAWRERAKSFRKKKRRDHAA